MAAREPIEKVLSSQAAGRCLCTMGGCHDGSSIWALVLRPVQWLGPLLADYLICPNECCLTESLLWLGNLVGRAVKLHTTAIAHNSLSQRR